MQADHVLPDVLRNHLKLVICGTAAGKTSAARGAYYAGRGNRFWTTLHAVGLTPHLLKPDQFHMVVEYGLGLTDIAKMRSGNDIELSKADFDVDGFRAKIKRYAPVTLAFNGKTAAEAYFSRNGRRIHWGYQVGTLGPAVWVLPSTSGSANGVGAKREEHWKALAESLSC